MEKFHGSGSLPSNNKPDANGKFQTKGKICYRCWKGTHQADKKCGAIDAIHSKCGKKGHFAVICQKGKAFSHSSMSAPVVETSSNTSTSQTEPDYYTECGQPIYEHLICCKPCTQNHGKFWRNPNYCWNSQSNSITKISIKMCCLKMIQVQMSIVSVLEHSTNSFLTSNSNRSTLLLENYVKFISDYHW